MLIEIFVDPIVVNGNIESKISSFRHGWHPKTPNQPNKYNVYNINDDDFKLLIYVMDHVAIVCDKQEGADFVSGNLFLKIVDDKKGNIEKDGFMKSIDGFDSNVAIVVDWEQKDYKKEYKIENVVDIQVEEKEPTEKPQGDVMIEETETEKPDEETIEEEIK